MNDSVKPGDVIICFGQRVTVMEIESDRYYLEHPIVVPTKEYTRNYVYLNEIKKKL